MTAVDTVTGEIIEPIGNADAVALTQRIKDAAESIWSLLLEAHERQAWRVLGYATWADYVKCEFDMSRSRSYHLLDQARVIREIGSVVSTSVDISEAEVRDLKPVVDEVKAEIAEAVKDAAPEDVPAIVKETITQKRETIRAARPAPKPNSVDAPNIGAMVAEARNSPSHVASKAFEQFILAKKIIEQAGGVTKIVADLKGDDGQMIAENWLAGLEPICDLLNDWCQRLNRRNSSLRRVQ